MGKKSKKIVFMLFFTFIMSGITSCGKKQNRLTFNPDYFLYHDDVAWVQVFEKKFFGPNDKGVACIDKNGIEIFRITDIKRDKLSNFYHGLAIADNRYIINKQGEVIHDLVKEFDINKVKIFPSKYFDGFIFVEKQVKGVLMTGILNENLQWLVEPTTKFNEIEAKGNYLFYSDTIGYYDVLTNEFIDEEDFNTRKFQRSFPENGLIFLSYNYDEFRYYDTYVNWDMAETNHHIYMTMTYKIDYENKAYLDIARGKIKIENADQTGFYNKDCELVLDLSQYNAVIPLSDCKNGKYLIKFKDEQNHNLVGLINMNGEFLFVRSGYKSYNSDKIEFYDCYFDWEGNYYVKETESE